MSLFHRSSTAPGPTLPGRSEPMPAPTAHAVSGHRIVPPFPAGMRTAQFAMGCFWGAEKLFWHTGGVYSTAAGYAGGATPNPTYEEVCSGRTRHAEAVLVVYDPQVVSYDQLLAVFWENHDPTQGDRQGNDHGSQYRSAIYYIDDDQRDAAERSRDDFGKRLADVGYNPVTTEIGPAGDFYYAEEHHQQYLHKVPGGYCPVHSTGVTCAVPGTAG
ncbi:MAG: peptide-methionine (S)-S-oxide reductase MsrA [Mycobacteriales bacterium]